MKVTLYGASGMIGSRILNELVLRRHQVTAVVRDPAKITRKDVTVRAGDLLDAQSIIETARGADAVISAYAPPPHDPHKLLEATRNITCAAIEAGVRRLLTISGAGTLEVETGIQLLETPDFPPAWKPIALAHGEALKILESADLDWTSLSPPATVQPGKRTGKFRLGENMLIVDDKGHSRISAEDLAVALVDELERPQYNRRRFTVGY